MVDVAEAEEQVVAAVESAYVFDDVKFATREISEWSNDRHLGEFIELTNKVLRLMKKAGVDKLMEESPHLDLDAAFERVWGRTRKSRFLNNLVITLVEIRRSVFAAVSPREDLIGTMAGLRPALEALNYFFALYARYRPGEVAFEIGSDALLGRDSPHTQEHDSFVARELFGCIADTSALIERFARLCAALAKERPATVQAKLYSDNGGGCYAELAMRMLGLGTKPERLAGALGRVKAVISKRCRGRARRRAFRHGVTVSAKAMVLQAKRANEAMSLRSRAN